MQCFLVPLGIKVQRHQSCLGKRKGIDWRKGEEKSQRKKSKIDSHRTVTVEYSSPDESIKFSLKNHLARDIISYYSQWLTKPRCCLLFWAKQQVCLKTSTRAILMSGTLLPIISGAWIIQSCWKYFWSGWYYLYAQSFKCLEIWNQY